MAQLEQRDSSNVARIPKTWTQRDKTNTLRTLKEIWMRDASNVLRKIYSGFAVQVSPTNVTGSGNSSTAVTIATDSANVTPTGGTAPYTYNWTLLSGASGWSANFPSAASTGFRKTLVGSGASFTSTWKCTVTDATGAALDTSVVTASVINVYGA